MEPPYKEKPQHWTGGNVFQASGKETFILAISPRGCLPHFLIHAAKVVIIFITITTTTLIKQKQQSI
jgi:hypothetical protein